MSKHGGAHCRNLANTIEPSMCGGDAAFLCKIYFEHCKKIEKLGVHFRQK